MLRRLITREGEAMPSFMRSTRSTPPALTADPLTVSVKTSSTLCASAHSKAFMIGSFDACCPCFCFCECGEHDLRRHRDRRDAYADGVEDGIGNGGGGRHIRRLTD